MDLYYDLCSAIKSKDFELAKFLLSAGAQVNADDQDVEEEAPLDLALRFGANVDVIQTILERGADVTKENENGELPLIVALEEKNLDAVKLILSCGADVFVSRSDGASFLHMAAELGSEELVEICLERGTFVNIEDGQQRTALHMAAKRGNESVVKLLLSHGADLHDADRLGRTALHYSAMGGHSGTLCTLIDYGGQIDRRDKNGRTCLHDASWLGHVDVVDILLNCHANVNLKDREGLVAVHHAAMRGHDDVISALLERGADLSIQDKQGRTPLHHAILRGSHHMIKMLIECGDDFMTPDSQNRSPIAVLLSVGSSTTAFHLNVDIDLSELIVKHVVRAKMMSSKTIGEEDFKSLRPNLSDKRWNELCSFSTECANEINKIKQYEREDDSFPVYDILTQKLRVLIRICAENEEAIADVDPSDWNRLFPIYGDFLKFRIQRATTKKDLQLAGARCLRYIVSRILPHVLRLPDIPCDLIMKSLTDIDLANLAEACGLREVKAKLSESSLS